MANAIQGEMDAFKAFIARGNVVDLAVAFVVGAAFQALISSLSSNLITPIIGVFGHVNFSELSFTINNSVFSYGLFLNAVVSFVIIAVVVFFLVVRPIEKMHELSSKKKPAGAPTTKTCPECLSSIPVKATRCAFCTSKLEG